MKRIIAVLLLVSTVFMFTPVYAATSAPVEYTLPYPGILTDHPLYFLKKLRDQIMEKLVADPIRKVEFYILQADKYMNMGGFLVAKNKEGKAIETMMLGTNRMGQAISTAMLLKEQGKEVPPYLVERIANALAKYEEVTTELTDAAMGEKKDMYTGIMNEIKKLQDEATKLNN